MRDRFHRLEPGTPFEQPAEAPVTSGVADAAEQLQLLAEQLVRHDALSTRLVRPPGKPVALLVSNREIPGLTEEITYSTGTYLWSWAEPIHGTNLAATAEAII